MDFLLGGACELVIESSGYLFAQVVYIHGYYQATGPRGAFHSPGLPRRSGSEVHCGAQIEIVHGALPTAPLDCLEGLHLGSDLYGRGPLELRPRVGERASTAGEDHKVRLQEGEDTSLRRTHEDSAQALVLHVLGQRRRQGHRVAIIDQHGEVVKHSTALEAKGAENALALAVGEDMPRFQPRRHLVKPYAAKAIDCFPL
mmetsp:Transcript_94743/g.203520  ORF Transcript_94743/g.203520 Transcript_94743/m.203520 type:complete len:200 (+) Transcript_94743:1486-2085(+)